MELFRDRLADGQKDIHTEQTSNQTNGRMDGQRPLPVGKYRKVQGGIFLTANKKVSSLTS